MVGREGAVTATPVLVVGGGPVGLTASICLSRAGVKHVLVERHPGTTLHPKARNLNLRTMEIMRPWYIETALFEQALPRAWTGSIIYATSLAGREVGRMRTASFESATTSPYTPVRGVLSSQDVYEPILRRLAEGLGPGELRFSTVLDAFQISGDVVRARLRNRETEATSEIACRYLLACDGWNSSVRRQLRIAMEGPSELGHFVNVYFRADLSPWVASRPALLYFVASNEATGVFQPLDGRGRWLCQISYDGRASSFAAYDQELCCDWIRRAVGSPDVTPEILSVDTWTMNATVAAAFREGPVFLAGDAAHQLPPTGGFGMNTGVQDVHNLAWKLGGVLDGWAGEGLLDSYETERRPVARTNADRSLDNSRMVARINRAALAGSNDSEEALAASRRYGNFMGMDLGFHYEAGALVADGSEPPDVEDVVIDYAPTERPGHRAPHFSLQRNGEEISSLDLFDGIFSLLTGCDGAPWVAAAAAISAETGLPLQVPEVDEDGWEALYGVGPSGAVLVRPDGHVAWRAASRTTTPEADLRAVVQRVAGHSEN